MIENNIISPVYLKQKLKTLIDLGVKIPNGFKLGDMRGHYNIVLSFESQFTIAEILGKKIGYENIELEPKKNSQSKLMDVDIIVQSDYDYHIQNKSPYFFESKYGRKVDECVRKDFYNTLGSGKNLFLKKFYGRPGNSLYRREVDGLKKDACFGIFFFEPSFCSLKYLETKIEKILRSANRQLTKSEGVKIISLDVRHFPVGEDVIHSIIRKFLDMPRFKYICCILLLTHDIENISGHFIENRLIPIVNYNYHLDYSVFDYETFGMKDKILLYRKKLFVLPTRVKVEKKGWNEFITIDKGNLTYGGHVFGKLF